ncbi:hypothetical protein ACVWY5_006662 [Bradyrhizobium sp. USDA 3256]
MRQRFAPTGWLAMTTQTWMAGSSPAMTTERRLRPAPYRTTAAVCPNSNLRSSSVRIAGWPKFGLTSFALA